MLLKFLQKKEVCIRQLSILILILALTGLFPASDFACAQPLKCGQSFLSVQDVTATDMKESEILITEPEVLATISDTENLFLSTGRFFRHSQNPGEKIRTLVRFLSLTLSHHLFSIFMSLCFLLFSVFMLQVKQRLSIILYIHHQDGQKGLSVLS